MHTAVITIFLAGRSEQDYASAALISAIIEVPSARVALSSTQQYILT